MPCQIACSSSRCCGADCESAPDVIAAIRAANATPARLFAAAALLEGQTPLWLSGGRAQLAGERGAIELVVDPELGLVIRRKGE